MSGTRLFTFREGDRSEYLASFLLSALGLVTAVERQEDIGFDFYCSLADQEDGALTFGYPFLVQIKSIGSPVFDLLPKKNYVHDIKSFPQHLLWLRRQEVPLFLGVVDRKQFSIQLFSLAPFWFISFGDPDCRDCSGIRFIPRLDRTLTSHVGKPVRKERLSENPASYAYDVDLGFPIATFNADDTHNRDRMREEKERLRFALEFEMRSQVFFRSSLRHFYWFAETDRSKGGPICAFYFDEMPNDAELLRNAYSFLGPALIPLALRYKADGKQGALHGLSALFREMPPATIPEAVKKELPAVFMPKPPVEPETYACLPEECSPGELAQFVELVRAGGEVANKGLEDRIRGAASLIFLKNLQAIAALKNPSAAYREKVSRMAAIPLEAADYPYELGWVFVTPSARGLGYSRDLVRAAVEQAHNAGIFATSRENNEPMHRALAKFGFKKVGVPYKSDRGNYNLIVLTRTPV